MIYTFSSNLLFCLFILILKAQQTTLGKFTYFFFLIEESKLTKSLTLYRVAIKRSNGESANSSVW